MGNGSSRGSDSHSGGNFKLVMICSVCWCHMKVGLAFENIKLWVLIVFETDKSLI